MTSINSGVFTDFCQAWVARFPGSELPAAWEEDVRANLKKHKTKVAILREELEKEEMYVEYLDKLLIDIGNHKKLSNTSNSCANTPDEANKQMSSSNYHTLEEIERLTTHHIEQNTSNASQKAENSHADVAECDSGYKDIKHGEIDKPTLYLDTNRVKNISETGESESDTAKADDVFGESTFVTVINVPSASVNEKQKKHDKSGTVEQSGRNNREDGDRDITSNDETRKAPLPTKRNTLKGISKLGRSRESLNSVSSPVHTPIDSPLISPSSTEDFAIYPREGLSSRTRTGTNPSNLSTFNSSISSTSTSASSHSDHPENHKKEDKPRRENKTSVGHLPSESLKRSHPVTKRALTLGSLPAVSHNTFDKKRGQPDGNY